MNVRRRWLVGALLAVDIVVAGTLIIVAGGDDGGQVRTEENPTSTTVAGNQAMPPISARPRATTSTTTTAPPTTTTTAPPTTTTVPPPTRPVARPAAPGDIDGDGVADRVNTERIGYGPGDDDEWMLTADLSTLGTRRLPFLVDPHPPVGDVWGVTDADQDGFAEIFVRVMSGADHVRLGVVRLIDDRLVQVKSDDDADLELAVGSYAAGGVGFACRDELVGLAGWELVVTEVHVVPGTDPPVVTGEDRIYRWTGEHVEVVSTRPRTTSDGFETLACPGVAPK